MIAIAPSSASGVNPLRILVVHERYASRGGEDESVDAEVALLGDRGHQVHLWTVDNGEIEAWGMSRKARLLWRTTWSRGSYWKLRALVEERDPDVVHFHNTLPIISPSAIHAARDAGGAVVMTLHNYRLMCPAGTFLRDGRVCEDCHSHSLASGVVHGCYRSSRLQTAAVASMLAVHRRLGTWQQCVDAYVAVSGFMRAKMIEGGLSSERTQVNPNPVTVTCYSQGRPEDFVVFAGRLSEEKGIDVLIESAQRTPGVRFKVIGAGPMDACVRAAAASLNGRLEVVGALPRPQALDVVRRARLLIFPSICYESFGRSMVEALACGVPVVASRLGAMAEILTDGQEGFLVKPGDACELADRINRIMSDESLRQRMSLAARATYETRYSLDRCYQGLMEIYRAAIESARRRQRAA